MDKKFNIKHNKSRIDKQYYIDRYGKVHKYKGDLSDEIVSIHYRIAKSIYPDSDNPDDVLLGLGWIMVGSSCYHQPIIHRRATQSQINTLDKLDLYTQLTFLHEKHYINYEKYNILIKETF